MKKLLKMVWYNQALKKLLLKMKLTIAIFLFSLASVSATTYAQVTRLDISSNKNILELFREIEDKSEFYFFYQKDDLKELDNVNVNVEDATVMEILDEALKGTVLDYTIVDRYIIVRKSGDNFGEGIITGQQRIVSGRVADSEGQPLPGVTVIIKGTTQGTVTNADGNYSLSDIPEGATLQFSFVGMKTQEITPGDKNVIDIIMENETVGIDEVIAIGYGTTTKRTTTAAVSKVNVDNMLNLPVSTIGQALAGRTAGLIVTNNGGGLGNNPTISVRGGGSPVLIIDGVMTSDIGEMDRMNPKDIESFTVLKDAEAVAIYGSKGGNGAIIITTRRGNEGKVNINYGYSHNFSQPTILPNKLSSYEMVMIRNEAADNDGQAHPYTDEVVQKYKDQSDPFNYPNTDWQKETLDNFAQESKHDLSISGGDKKTRYYSSLSYFDQGSLYKFDTNWLKRYTYRMSISNNFENIGLKTNLAFFGDVEKTRAPYSHYSTGYWQTWGHIQNQDPMSLAYTDLGLYSAAVDHPIVEIDPNSGYDRNEDRNVNAQLNLDWSVPKVNGLNLKLMGYYSN